MSLTEKEKDLIRKSWDQVREYFESHPEMKAHLLRIASSIRKIAESPDSPAKLNEELDSISKIHMDKQVKPTDLESLGEALINFLKEALKKKRNDDVIVAWSKAYEVIKQGILDKMQQQ